MFGEVAYIVFFEVPLQKHSGRNESLGIAVAAVTEVLAQVVTVTESPNILCKEVEKNTTTENTSNTYRT